MCVCVSGVSPIFFYQSSCYKNDSQVQLYCSGTKQISSIAPSFSLFATANTVSPCLLRYFKDKNNNNVPIHLMFQCWILVYFFSLFAFVKYGFKLYVRYASAYRAYTLYNSDNVIATVVWYILRTSKCTYYSKNWNYSVHFFGL